MIVVDDLAIRQGKFRLERISFTLPKGTYAVLMGRTGCGKTTLLEAVAGLRAVTAGRIRIDGKDVTDLDPASRGIGYVPQDGALFRTMSVRDNLGFALAIRKERPEVIAERVNELAAWLEVDHLLDRLAVGLSGGETQRIALGRALAFCPSTLLMDEPLSSLDEETRETLIELLRDLRKEGKVTVLHVSHNRQEAEALGEIVLRLKDGRIEMGN